MSDEADGAVKGFVEFLVRNLVDQPDQVEIREVPDGEGATLEVHVGPGDLGKVIGKQGRIANALRTVAKTAGFKDRRRIYVDIVS